MSADEMEKKARPLVGALWMLPALLLLPVSYVLPPIDLEGLLALAAYGLSESGGVFGLPWVAVVFTALIASAAKARWVWAAPIFLVLLLLLGGISAVNESWTKHHFAAPRPNIIELSEAGVLETSAEDFYREPDKDARRRTLEAALKARGERGPRLHPWIRAHWSREAGYSFPSGHSLAAFLFATIFVGLGLAHAGAWRRGLCLALIPWAAAVAFSRVLLRVHSPLDITVGGSLGLVLGALGLVVLRRLLAPGVETAE